MKPKKVKKCYKFAVLKFQKVNTKPGILQTIPGPVVPKPRSGHRIVCDDANLYSFGGYNPNLENDAELKEDNMWGHTKPLFVELWKLNFASQRWSRVLPSAFIPLPSKVASHAMVLLRGNIVVYGGTGMPFGQASSNTINVFNLQRQLWQELQSEGELPEPMYGQAVAVTDHQLFTVGGTTGWNYSNEVHRFDFNNNTWERLCNLTDRTPRSRYRHEIVVHNHRLFVFGGGTAYATYSLKSLPTFLILERKWTVTNTLEDVSQTRRKFPDKRRSHSLVQHGNDVYILGGYDGVSIREDFWKLNLDTMQWTCLVARVPKPTYFHSSSVTEAGCMYTFGGVTHLNDNSETRRTDHVYKVWLKIPSLREISWEALLYYLQNTSFLTRKQLLELGVPLEFVNRAESGPGVAWG